ncbi:hypothetical protein MMC11_003792 [Xylographa trunciseda]|nr:hypothetical protein [Xylographa trunciseda]
MVIAILLFCFLPLFVNAQCKPLSLTWANYTATLDEAAQICKYQNVRFAGPPTGNLRFGAPTDPQISDPPAPTMPVSCIQIDKQDKCSPSNGDALVDKDCSPPLMGAFVEDCLFLDIYVPLTAFKSPKPVSVVVWIYGGAFVYGSKGEFDLSKFPLYSGKGAILSAKNPMIFVAANYRLGAFGWLAGSSMEAKALPNAGLYDQRKALNFTKNYIGLLNGDPAQVSAWGESAGAASILHHLVSANGKQDPLFSKAVLQSPAFEWQWNRTGTLENTYQQFAGFAGCPGGDIGCLRQATSEMLNTANQKLFHVETLCNGIFPVGPALDRDLIQTLPSVAFSTNRYWPGLKSLMVSHVNNEVAYNGSFIPYPIRRYNNATGFDNFLSAFMPGNTLATLRADIAAHYPVTAYKNDQISRTGAVIQDSTFVCNTRQLFNAYSQINTPVYMMNYHFLANEGKAVHASDLLPTFYNKDMDVAALLCNWPAWIVNSIIKPNIAAYARSYASYLTSYTIFGNPNEGASGGAAKVHWPPATTSADGNYVQNVLEPYWAGEIPGKPWFRLATQDTINTKDVCGYWDKVAQQIMSAPGVASPVADLLTVQEREVEAEL